MGEKNNSDEDEDASQALPNCLDLGLPSRDMQDSWPTGKNILDWWQMMCAHFGQLQHSPKCKRQSGSRVPDVTRDAAPSAAMTSVFPLGYPSFDI